MARHSREARRRGAAQASLQGIQRVADSHGVTAATVQRWCREFPQPHPARHAARARPAAAVKLTAQQRAKLTGLSLGFAPNAFGYIRSNGEFAPRRFADALAVVAQKHRSAQTPEAAFSGLVAAVADVRSAAERYIGGPHAGTVGEHAARLSRVVEIIATKTAASGPERGLRLLNDTLERWGRSGIDPDQLLQGDRGVRHDELRLKLESAAEGLSPKLKAHPGYDSGYDRRRQPQCCTTRFGVDVLVDFERWPGFGIFKEAHCEHEAEAPDLSPEGRQTLIKMATDAAEAAGLTVGDDIKVSAMAQEKGLVSISLVYA